MRILIAGASGLPRHRGWSPHLRAAGHEVTRLVRRPAAGRGEAALGPGRRAARPGSLAGADAVVNLAGAGVGDQRWTDAVQAAAPRQPGRHHGARSPRRSRTPGRPPGCCSTPPPSAATATPATGAVDEDAPAGDGLPGRLCRVWEAGDPARPRTPASGWCCCAPGSPLAATAACSSRCCLPFKLCAGGRLGSGRQYLPWISVPDWLDAVRVPARPRRSAGPVNLTGPEPVTNAEFTARAGAGAAPADLLPVPGHRAARPAVGEFGGEALASQRVLPGVLVREGFPFAHRTVEAAFSSAVSATT